jgi:hypothetical protein
MNGREMDELIEISVTAHRQRDAQGHLAPPAAWWDLPPAALDELLDRQLLTRALERLIDPEGESATVKAVMARIVGG